MILVPPKKQQKIISYWSVFNFGHPEKRPKSLRLPQFLKEQYWFLVNVIWYMFQIPDEKYNKLSNIKNWIDCYLMDLTSATRPKTLTLLYLSEFLIDFYRIFRDLRIFFTWLIYFEKLRKIFFAHAQCF